MKITLSFETAWAKATHPVEPGRALDMVNDLVWDDRLAEALELVSILVETLKDHPHETSHHNFYMALGMRSLLYAWCSKEERRQELNAARRRNRRKKMRVKS